MPEREVAPDLAQLTIQRAAVLKSYWKVAMSALIRLALDLRRVTERQYRFLCMSMGQCGYRTIEPVRIPDERPTVVRDIIAALRKQGHGLSDLSRLTASYEAEFRADYMVNQSGFRVVD